MKLNNLISNRKRSLKWNLGYWVGQIPLSLLKHPTIIKLLLSQLVIEAKTKIREQYPDEDTSVTDESQVTQEQQEQTVEETVVE